MRQWWVVSAEISIFPRVDFSASRGELVITNKYQRAAASISNDFSRLRRRQRSGELLFN